MSGIQPTRAAVRALDAAHGVGSVLTVVDNAVKVAVQARVTATSLAAVAVELNVSASRLQRYLTGTPHKGDVMTIQMMWASWVELLPPPTLASLNYTQVDVLGGGADIVLTGTNLTGATAVEFRLNGSGGAWTAAASLGANTATTQAVQPPALAAGSYDVRITAPNGVTTMLNAIEAWAPTTDAAVTALDEAPDYNSTTGVWTSRFGGVNASWKDAKVPAVSGAPNFDGTGCLDSAATLATYVPATGGGIAVVTTATNTDAMSTSLPYNNATIVTAGSPGGQGTIGLTVGQLASVQGYMAHIWDSTTYRTAFVAAAVGGPRTAIMQFSPSALSLTVDGTTVSASPAPAANWGLSTGVVRYGGKYLLTSAIVKLFRGTTRAVCLFSGAPAGTFNNKFRKWAQQRHLAL